MKTLFVLLISSFSISAFSAGPVVMPQNSMSLDKSIGTGNCDKANCPNCCRYELEGSDRSGSLLGFSKSAATLFGGVEGTQEPNDTNSDTTN